MNILLVTGYFPPERAAGPNLNYELGRELLNRGHKVTVATCFPRYNLDKTPEEYQGKLFMTESIDGMKVIRTWYPVLSRSSPILRGLDIFLMALALIVSGLRAGKQDVANVFSPPLTTGLSGYVLSKVFRYPYVYNVHDLFPQNAIDLGVLRNQTLIRFFRWMERFIYKKAPLLTTISPTNQAHVLNHGGTPDRTTIIPDWVDTTVVAPDREGTDLARELGIEGKFVASFAGVMGFSQDLDTILEAAHLLKEQPEICFLLVGDGVEKPRLQEKATQLGLDNVIFLPMLPREKVIPVFQSSDVCLATLHASVKTSPVPSKIIWGMAAGNTIVACINSENDAHDLIQDAECGITIAPGKPQALADSLVYLQRNQEEARQMGRNGRSYVEGHLSLKYSALRFEGLFEKAIAKKQGKAPTQPGVRL